MSGYEVLTALSNKPKLRVVNIVNSGPIRAEWAVDFLKGVPNLNVFLFTSYYHHDTSLDRIRWYKILRQQYKHITFSDNFIKKVERYEVEDSHIVMLKYLDNKWSDMNSAGGVYMFVSPDSNEFLSTGNVRWAISNNATMTISKLLGNINVSSQIVKLLPHSDRLFIGIFFCIALQG